MAIITYNIISGVAPFIAELNPSLVPVNTHVSTGTYQFSDVPNGGYTLIIKDSNNCEFQEQITVDPNVTTTTTTLSPSDSIVIGNSQDESLIFNVSATNRDSHYVGYPNPNLSTLFLWLKTLNEAPLAVQRVVNYSISSSYNSTFKFNSLSDEIHTDVVQSTVGPLSNINGQIILKPGFIETYFMYTYSKDSMNPDFQINLSSIGEWLDVNVPITGGTNQYGITNINRNSIIMNF